MQSSADGGCCPDGRIPFIAKLTIRWKLRPHRSNQPPSFHRPTSLSTNGCGRESDHVRSAQDRFSEHGFHRTVRSGVNGVRSPGFPIEFG